MIAIASLVAMLLAFAVSPALSQATKLFVNQFPLYSQLESCAMAPISTIVRGMAIGCGDGGALTSYSCFCGADSSMHWNTIIASSISKQCSGTLIDVVSGLAVFQSYCDLSNSLTSTASSNSSSSTSFTTPTITAAVVSTVTVTSAASTATQTREAAGSSSNGSVSSASAGMSTGAKAGIAIGIVALVLAAAGLAAFIYYRRRSLSNTPRGQDPFTLIDTRPNTAQPPPIQPANQSQEAGWEWRQVNRSPASTYLTNEKLVAGVQENGPSVNAYGIGSPGGEQVHEMCPVNIRRHELS